MGSSCTCNCARTTPETAVEEEATPSTHAPKRPADGALEEVKVPPGAGGSVPIVAKFRVLQQGWRNSDQHRGTPRFDEASQPLLQSSRSEPLRTPGRSTSGDARAIGWTPRDSPMPTARGGDAEAEVHYEGAYLGSQKHGLGTLRMQACTYVGSFWHDAKHGEATLRWDDGREYRGQFRQGMFHGSAIMIWPDGRRYEGQYAENQKHGDGTFTWQDGRRYEGQWMVGKRHGVGTYTNAKGLSRCGTWERDRPVRWQSDAVEDEAAGAPEADDGGGLVVLQAPGDDADDVTNL